VRGGVSLGVTVKDKQRVGREIKKQRQKDKKSLRGLAAECEMSYATLNDIENGNGFPTEKVFLRLVKNLNFSHPEKLYDLYAEVKDTAPPDVIDFLSKNKETVSLVRQVIVKDKGAAENG